MSSFATVQEFLTRVDLSSGLVSPLQDGGVNEPRIQAALDDATAELEGYLPRVPAQHAPDANTKRVHCIKVAQYLLTLDRPGAEFMSISKAYNDTIAFYTGLIQGAASATTTPLEGSAESPAPAFTDETLKGFV